MPYSKKKETKNLHVRVRRRSVAVGFMPVALGLMPVALGVMPVALGLMPVALGVMPNPFQDLPLNPVKISASTLSPKAQQNSL